MIRDLKVLAIVPARGGSKRIPDKNIKPLLGKPLIAYAIEQGKASKYIDRVVVSTDSEKIQEVGLAFGAEAPFLRPAEISGDKATDLDAFVHALGWFETNEKYIPDIIVQLRPTSPLRTAETIDACIEGLIENKEADSVRTVTRPEQHPYKMFAFDDAGFLKPLFSAEGKKDGFNLSEQMLPKCVKHVGYVDVMWRKTLLEKKSMTGDRIYPLYVEGAISGINSPEDWDYYEFILKKKGN